MKKDIVTNLLSIEEITSNTFFKIPDYQRGYSWEEDQLKDLVKDIKHIANKNHRHYTGTIVISNSNGDERFDVVDGQQRLTSLIILLKLIYDIDPETGHIGNDIQIVGDKIFLRAERTGKSAGRIYTIIYEATDCAGNTTTVSKTVTVPHDMR